MTRKRIAGWIIALATVVPVLIALGVRHWRPHWSIIQGAVIRSDTDTRKQSPIAGVAITASHGDVKLSTESDASGYFKIAFPGTVLPGSTVVLDFQQKDFKPLELQDTIRFRSSLRQLVIAAMEPAAVETPADSQHPPSVVSNIKVRYTVNSQNDQNIGSEAKHFRWSISEISLAIIRTPALRMVIGRQPKDRLNWTQVPATSSGTQELRASPALARLRRSTPAVLQMAAERLSLRHWIGPTRRPSCLKPRFFIRPSSPTCVNRTPWFLADRSASPFQAARKASVLRPKSTARKWSSRSVPIFT